jgi:hypothetical protein
MIKNDGRCWIHLPTDLTDPTLTESAAGAINFIHQLQSRPLVAAGQRNPYYDVITQIGIAPGASINRVLPLAECGPVNNLARVPLSLVDLVIAVGGEVEGLPVFFELAADPATLDCPFSTTTPVEKWSTWGTFGQSHVPVQIGNRWYRSSAVGQSGELLKASLWIARSRSNVISLAEYQQILSENAPVP